MNKRIYVKKHHYKNVQFAFALLIGVITLTFIGCRPSLPHDVAVVASNLSQEHQSDLRYKIFLKSGRSAIIELGGSKGWLKISLLKTDWNAGSVIVFYSKTDNFVSGQKTYAHYENQMDFHMLRFDELGVNIVLELGSPNASYLSILQGEGTIIRRVESPDGKNEPLSQD